MEAVRDTALTREHCLALDRSDPLRESREAFSLPDGILYLDGNSLGALPRASAERVETVLHEQWGRDLIRSWNDHEWIHLPLIVGRKIAQIVGADASEVAVADSTSVNLFKLLAASTKLRPDRPVIVSEEGNFPSDIYMAEGLIDFLGDGYELRLAPSGRIDEALADDVAVVSLTHVNYRTGFRHDMDAVTQSVHDVGALMLWDLAHSAGSMPIDMHASRVDLAVGCGYKFLNGGPGAPAFIYVAAQHHANFRQPLTGWLGHASPFEFAETYEPAPGIARNLCGTPPILSMASLDAALDVMLNADIHEIRAKSLRLGDLFLDLVAQECGEFDFAVACPRDQDQRGSQVCLSHENGFAIVQALIANGVIGDFRTPDVLRFGITPLYQRYVDMWDAVAVLREVMTTECWREPRFQTRATVT